MEKLTRLEQLEQKIRFIQLVFNELFTENQRKLIQLGQYVQRTPLVVQYEEILAFIDSNPSKYLTLKDFTLKTEFWIETQKILLKIQTIYPNINIATYGWKIDAWFQQPQPGIFGSRGQPSRPNIVRLDQKKRVSEVMEEFLAKLPNVQGDQLRIELNESLQEDETFLANYNNQKDQCIDWLEDILDRIIEARANAYKGQFFQHRSAVIQSDQQQQQWQQPAQQQIATSTNNIHELVGRVTELCLQNKDVSEMDVSVTLPGQKPQLFQYKK